MWFSLLLFFLSFTYIHVSMVSSTSTNAACSSTSHPQLCLSVLSSIPPSNLSAKYNYACFSVRHSLNETRHLAILLDRRFGPYDGPVLHGVNMSGVVRLCKELFRLNLDYLKYIWSDLKVDESKMTWEDADRALTMISAMLTNQETCLDELESEGSTWEGLHGVALDVKMFYVVTLGLVANALEHRAKPPTTGLELYSGWNIGNLVWRSFLDDIRSDIPANHSVVVAKDGSGNFTTIGAAVEWVPSKAKEKDGRYLIVVREGTYYENVVVSKDKKYVTMVGEGINCTVVSGNRSNADGDGTYFSSTFAVRGLKFIAANMTFENRAGPQKHQAVAVRNEADMSIFYKCSFLGYQDTLYVHNMRQFYRECDVYGTVDFIFGNAAAVLQNCNIYPRKPLLGQKNTITAQGRSDDTKPRSGISIHNCTIRPAPDLEADPGFAETYLGRPWKMYSTTVFMQSYIDGIVAPAGWLEWNGSFGLDTLFYGEFNNHGPGSNVTLRVGWEGFRVMDEVEAFRFTAHNFTAVGFWLNRTHIPYNPGL